MMKRYTPEELAEVLCQPRLWLDGEKDGSRAVLTGADLTDAVKIAFLAVFTGLYDYQCWAVATEDGTAWVRMGCLFKTVDEWDSIGIRASNTREYPDTGSEKCEARVRAFDFTRAEDLRMAEKVKEWKEVAE